MASLVSLMFTGLRVPLLNWADYVEEQTIKINGQWLTSAPLMEQILTRGVLSQRSFATPITTRRILSYIQISHCTVEEACPAATHPF